MKKLMAILLFTTFLIFLNSCGSTDAKPPVEKKELVKEPVKNTDPYKDVKFDAKKDPVCGMPLTAGVGDTAHYKNGVYGFCSKECKDEFEKNPLAFIRMLQ